MGELPRAATDSAPSEGRRDRRRGGGDSRTGRRRAGTQRRACATEKLQTPARPRTGDRHALPDSLTHGLRTRGAPATPRKFHQSAPTRLPGRGVGPRYFRRHTKERGGCGVCGGTPAPARTKTNPGVHAKSPTPKAGAAALPAR